MGQNLRRFRQRQGMTQETVELLVRRAGLKWTRSTVAEFEAGTKSLSMSEFVALCRCFPPDLLAGDEEVQIGTSTVDLKTVRKVLAARGGDRRVLPSPERGSPDWFREKLRETKVVSTHETVLGEAERKAARKFGVHAVEVVNVAFKLWNRTLTEERDARVAELMPPELDMRSRQAFRGRVTRTLLKEVEPHLPKRRRR